MKDNCAAQLRHHMHSYMRCGKHVVQDSHNLFEQQSLADIHPLIPDSDNINACHVLDSHFAQVQMVMDNSIFYMVIDMQLFGHIDFVRPNYPNHSFHYQGNSLVEVDSRFEYMSLHSEFYPENEWKFDNNFNIMDFNRNPLMILNTFHTFLRGMISLANEKPST